MAKPHCRRFVRIPSLVLVGCALLSSASAPASSTERWPSEGRRIRTTRVDLDSTHLQTTWLTLSLTRGCSAVRRNEDRQPAR